MNDMGEENGLASKEQIRAVGQRGMMRRYAVVGPLPVNRLKLRVQSLSEREMAQHDADAISYNRAGVKRSAIENANARLFVRCIVDGDGNRVFGDGETTVFANWDAADTRHLYDEIADHCGIRRASDEDLAKNSEITIVEEPPIASQSE